MKPLHIKTKTVLRILILLSLTVLSKHSAKAQYISPYEYAYFSAKIDESLRLKNITFNENELKMDADAWEQYKYYQERNAQILKKSKQFEVAAYVGLGLVGVSFIPMFIGLNADYDDPKGDTALGWSLGLLSSGGLIMTIGAIGVLVQNDRYNDHKKEMIIYLKTNHNGLGIVSVF